MTLHDIPETYSDGIEIASGVTIVTEEDGTRIYVTKDGERHGQYRWLFPSGTPEQEGYYSHNKLQGTVISYSEAGEKLSTNIYNDGVQEGEWYTYYPSGAICSVQRYIKGQLQGLQEFLYEDGTIHTHMHFKDGKLHGKATLYYPSGKEKRELHFEHGTKKGRERQWNSQGVLILEAEYGENEALVGTTRRWHDSGAKWDERNHHPGTKFFDVKEWNKQGTLKKEGTLTNGTDYSISIYDDNGALINTRTATWDGTKMVF